MDESIHYIQAILPARLPVPGGAQRLITAVELQQVKHVTTSVLGSWEERTQVVEQIQQMWPVLDSSLPRGTLSRKQPTKPAAPLGKRKHGGNEALDNAAHKIAKAKYEQLDDENQPLPYPHVNLVPKEAVAKYIEEGIMGRCHVCDLCVGGTNKPCLIRQAVVKWDDQLGGVSRAKVKQLLAEIKARPRIGNRVTGIACRRCRICRNPNSTLSCLVVRAILAGTKLPDRLQSVLDEAATATAKEVDKDTDPKDAALLKALQVDLLPSSDHEADENEEGWVSDGIEQQHAEGSIPAAQAKCSEDEEEEEEEEDDDLEEEELLRWIPWAQHFGKVPPSDDSLSPGEPWVCKAWQAKKKGTGLGVCGRKNPGTAAVCLACGGANWTGPHGQLASRALAALQTGAGKELEGQETAELIAARMEWEAGTLPVPNNTKLVEDIQKQLLLLEQPSEVDDMEPDEETVKACKAMKNSLLGKATKQLEDACTKFAEDQAACMLLNTSLSPSAGGTPRAGRHRHRHGNIPNNMYGPGAPASAAGRPPPPDPPLSFSAFRAALAPALAAAAQALWTKDTTDTATGGGNSSANDAAPLAGELCALLFALGPREGWDAASSHELMELLGEEDTLHYLSTTAAKSTPKDWAATLAELVKQRQVQQAQQAAVWEISPRVRSTLFGARDVLATQQSQQQQQQEDPSQGQEAGANTASQQQQHQQREEEEEEGDAEEDEDEGIDQSLVYGLATLLPPTLTTGAAAPLQLGTTSTTAPAQGSDCHSEDGRQAALDAVSNGVLQLAWSMLESTLKQASRPVLKPLPLPPPSEQEEQQEVQVQEVEQQEQGEEAEQPKKKKRRGKNDPPAKPKRVWGPRSGPKLEPWEKMRKFPGLPPLPIPLTSLYRNETQQGNSNPIVAASVDNPSGLTTQQGVVHPVPRIGPLPSTLTKQLQRAQIIRPQVVDWSDEEQEESQNGQPGEDSHSQGIAAAAALLREIRALPDDVAAAFKAGLHAGMRIEQVAGALERYKRLTSPSSIKA